MAERFSARIRPLDATTLSSEVTGQLTYLARAGMRFKQGDTLARIDDALPRERLRLVETQILNQGGKIDLLKKRLEEWQQLSQQDFMSQKQVEDLNIELHEEKLVLNQLEDNKAELQHIVRRSQIKAPFDCIVTSELTALGETLVTGSKVMAISSISEFIVEASLPNDEFAKKRNVSWSLRVGDSSQPLRDVRMFVDPSRTGFPARLIGHVDPIEDYLGRSVEVVSQSSEVSQTNSVCSSALIEDKADKFHVLTEQNGKVRRRDVTVTSRGFETSEVNGLTPGEQIIVRGAQGLSENQLVRVVSRVASCGPNGD